MVRLPESPKKERLEYYGNNLIRYSYNNYTNRAVLYINPFLSIYISIIITIISSYLLKNYIFINCSVYTLEDLNPHLSVKK